MSREVIVCGLPLTKESATQEFFDLINSTNVTGVIANYFYEDRSISLDYASAQVGYSLLEESGWRFVDPDQSGEKTISMLNAWYEGDRRLSGDEITQRVCNFIDSLNFAGKIFYFCPGSPYHHDGISQRLISRGADVVDTSSSIHLTYDKIKTWGYNSPLHIVDHDTFELKNGHVNICCAIAKIYSGAFDIEKLITQIKPEYKYYSVKVGVGENVTKLTYSLCRMFLQNHLEYFNNENLVIITE